MSPLVTFLTAVQFLLVSPAFIKRPFTSRELGGGVGFYPLVGLVLGVILVGAGWVLRQAIPIDLHRGIWLPLPVQSALLMALWVVITGALHLDGFLDSCDGLFGGFTPEKRLEIMRDERVGGYALAGGVLLMLTQHSALTSLVELRWPALLLAPVFGRLAMALAIIVFPYGREKGLGREIKDNAGLPQALLALASTLLVTGVAGWFIGLLPVLGAWILAMAAWYVTARFIVSRIPGLTGDSYGAINILVETLILVWFSAVGPGQSLWIN
jgi:adenosylcobinamide-GDP ribazoletransferase